MALKVRNEIACKQTQAEIPDKQVCLLGIIFEIANSRDQLEDCDADSLWTFLWIHIIIIK